jgi:hypothetical protein
MNRRGTDIKRRHLLLGLAASATPFARRSARADAGPAALSLLVAGPDGGQTSRWGDACALAMSPCFAGAPAIIAQPLGGLDGVTGANRLDALVVPDGKTAAILPGAALIAWLAGDARVHFDPTRWEPVTAGLNSAVLVVRLGGRPANIASLRAIAPLRIAADSPQSNDLAALIALQRMGVKTAPVFALRDREARINAFASGAVDAVFLSGEGVPEDIAPLAANGGAPLFCFGTAASTSAATPDPIFPGLPSALIFSEIAASPLDAVCHAAAAAALMDFAIVLPKLTDPGAVAQWRQAAAGAIAAPALAAAASASAVTLCPSAPATAQFAAFNLAPAEQQGLQAFLTTHFGWQQG